MEVDAFLSLDLFFLATLGKYVFIPVNDGRSCTFEDSVPNPAHICTREIIRLKRVVIAVLSFIYGREFIVES